MRHPVSTLYQRAERRASPKPVLSLVEGPAPGSRETRLPFVPSMPAQAGMEPRHSLPLGDRPTYPLDEGL
jgi:hypothetical protein